MTVSLRKPLEGLLVVALEQAVAAPFCTSRLADAGARVIKVERPEGDFARGYDDVAAGQSSYFVWLNRGKESLLLDLTDPAQRATLSELLASADVMIQNLKPGALDRLGFSAASLRQKHPKLVICSISGYGETGPLADRKAYDMLIQAESGLCSITGGAMEPARVGISLVDIATGATAYGAIMEALVARNANGEGADIHVSMFDVIAEWLTVPLLHQEAGKPPRRIGLAHPSIAPYGVFATRDGKQILISIQSDREWVKLCTEMLGDPSLAQDPRFATNVARVQNRSDTDALVAAAFASKNQGTAIDSLSNADVAFASLNDMAALSTHPHLRKIAIETPEGVVNCPAPAPVIRGVVRTYGSVPALGVHSQLPVQQT
jgi:crotonobetainyl-CoA:carnitine CoA-transferase CaiB-like acyl-CoA transferase